MGFSRNLLWLVFGIIPFFLFSGCGDLEPEMQDTRSVVLKMNFHQRSSSRSSQISQAEVSIHKTHLILAVPAWEQLSSNYRNYYSSFAQELMNPSNNKVSLEIPLNTQMKIFAFLFMDDYTMPQLFSRVREVGYYGESQPFSIGTNTNNLRLGITLQSAGTTAGDGEDSDGGGDQGGTDSTAPFIDQVTAVTSPTSDSTPNYTFASIVAGTITYGGSCSSGISSAVSGNNTITFLALNDGTYIDCTITVTDYAGNASNTLAIPAFTIDTAAPTVSFISPTDNQSDVSISDNISVTFSEAMDITSVTTNTDSTTCLGTFKVSSDNFSSCLQMSSSPSSSNSDKTFRIDPTDNLSIATRYKIRLTTGVKDSAGNTLDIQYETSNGFTSRSATVYYGNYVPFNRSSSHSPNYLLGSSLVVSQASTLDAFGLIAVSSGYQVQMALYTDNNGVPGSLFASSPITTVTGSGVLELDVTDQSLPAGTYWIMAVYSSQASVSFTSSTSATVKYKALSFGNSLPTSFGSASSYNGQEFSYYLIAISP